eukprot:1515260-Pyramimonas_sp.AAC.1
MSARSPKNWPGPSLVSRRPSLDTDTSPSLIRKKECPTSPCKQQPVSQSASQPVRHSSASGGIRRRQHYLGLTSADKRHQLKQQKP